MHRAWNKHFSKICWGAAIIASPGQSSLSSAVKGVENIGWGGFSLLQDVRFSEMGGNWTVSISPFSYSLVKKIAQPSWICWWQPTLLQIILSNLLKVYFHFPNKFFESWLATHPALNYFIKIIQPTHFIFIYQTRFLNCHSCLWKQL